MLVLINKFHWKARATIYMAIPVWWSDIAQILATKSLKFHKNSTVDSHHLHHTCRIVRRNHHPCAPPSCSYITMDSLYMKAHTSTSCHSSQNPNKSFLKAKDFSHIIGKLSQWTDPSTYIFRPWASYWWWALVEIVQIERHLVVNLFGINLAHWPRVSTHLQSQHIQSHGQVS